MKIAIDANELTLKENTGVKIYSREIIKALSLIDKKNEYILYAGLPIEAPYSYNAGNFKLKISKSRFFPWTYTTFPDKIKKDKPDVLFMPIQTSPFFKKPENIKIVVTAHDLAFLLFPNHFSAKNKFLLNLHTKRAVEMADRLIVPSISTKKDTIRFYKIEEKKIDVIYHGVTSFLGDSLRFNEKERERTKKDKPYILFVGTIQPRKNLTRLIEAFEIVKKTNKNLPNLKLIICGGRGWGASGIYEKARVSEVSKSIVFLGSVEHNELKELYQNALIFALPSLYEGFGLPVLEAMSCGVPCVVGDNSALSEIADDHALLANAYSSADIAEKINLFLKNDFLRNDFSRRSIKNAKNFSWAESAEKTLETFRKAME